MSEGAQMNGPASPSGKFIDTIGKHAFTFHEFLVFFALVSVNYFIRLH